MSTIKNLRKAKELSQEQLGELAGVSRIVIWRMEKGKAVQPISFKMTCQALGVSMEDVTGVCLYNAVATARKRKRKN